MNRQRRTTGIAYLIMDSCWYGLPAEVRKGTYWGFHKVFTIGGRRMMELKGVDQGQVPNHIDFVDALVQVHATPTAAKASMWTAVNRQLHQLSKIPQRYRNSPHYDVDVGVAYALKDGSMMPPVCITESVVSVNAVFRYWKLFRSRLGRNRSGPVSIAAADHETKKALGRALGRVIAHETYHQLCWTSMGAPPYAQPHWGRDRDPWLEAEGGGSNWWQDSSKFSQVGERIILDTIPKLDQLQGNEQTQFLARRGPVNSLLGDFPGTPRSAMGG